MSGTLVSEDHQAFARALKLYEKKEYNSCLTEVDKITARGTAKNRGELLCLKALTHYNLNQDSEEVASWIEEGTKLEPGSHVAWHMAGIYHKLRKSYHAAYEAYLKSYRCNQSNSNVHLDLAMLAAQERDYLTLYDMRYQIMGREMSSRPAWTAFAASQYLLNKNMLPEVCKTVKMYEKVAELELKNLSTSKLGKLAKKGGKSRKSDSATAAETPLTGTPQQIETSEMLMLRTRALLDQQKYAEALQDLAGNESRVLDKLAWHEAKAQALVHTDRPRGRDAYLQLLKRNPEHRGYYEQLERGEPNLARLYADLQTRFPHSDLAFGRPLQLFTVVETSAQFDPQWREHFWAYLATKLTKGTPSAFRLVQTLYSDADKRAAITEVVETKLGARPAASYTVAEQIYLARHYAATNAVNRGLALLNSALTSVDAKNSGADAKTSSADAEQGSADAEKGSMDAESVIDLQLARADLLQQAGALQPAAKELAEVSAANPGDRALNTSAANACFRAGSLEQGYALAYDFPIRGHYAKSPSEALKYLLGVESVNALLAMAEGHARCREFNLALKRALQVLDTYQRYYDELYDFHYYGPRRATLRAYIDTVHWADQIFSSPTYLRALEIAVDQWIHVARRENDGFTVEKHDQIRREQDEQMETLEIDGDDDEDPYGTTALYSESALADAYKWWQKIERPNLAPEVARRAYWIGFRILLAQKKYLLANKCLKQAKEAGLSASKLAAGGLMARHALETDEQAPQVLRSVQLKLLPAVVSAGDIVADDPVEFANAHVTDLADWVRVRRYINALDGVEPTLIARLKTVTESAAEAEDVYLVLQRELGYHEQLAEAIKSQWPLQTFVST